MRRRHQAMLLILSGAAMTALASPALAENPIYLVGELGSTSMDTDLGESFRQIIDGDDDSWAFGVGLRLGDYLAFQAEYQDFGSLPGTGSPWRMQPAICSRVHEVCRLIVEPDPAWYLMIRLFSCCAKGFLPCPNAYWFSCC